MSTIPPAGVVVPYIVFTDAIGTLTIQSGWPRWKGWMPDATVVGTSAVRLGSGITDMWSFRDDFTAKFTIPLKRASDTVALHRLKLWLESGGAIGVTTNDLLGSGYVAVINPKAKIAIAVDPDSLDYTLQLDLKNVGCTLEGFPLNPLTWTGTLETLPNTFTWTGSLATVGTQTAGGSSLTLAATTISGTLIPGQSLTVGGQTFTVVEVTSQSGTTIVFEVSPVIAANIAGGTVVAAYYTTGQDAQTITLVATTMVGSLNIGQQITIGAQIYEITANAVASGNQIVASVSPLVLAPGIAGSTAVTGPAASTLVTAAAVTAGASSIPLTASDLEGWAAPGDEIVIGGNTYTVTAPVEDNGSNQITVAIKPNVVAGGITNGAAVAYYPAAVSSMVAEYEA